MYRPDGLYIDGQWRASADGASFTVINPATEDEVIERANSLSVGLAGYVFTRSLKRAHEISEAMETGMVAVDSFA
jgi:acyl-CoA reductase-like NAD-dependent aldehyde dehydrogenase